MFVRPLLEKVGYPGVLRVLAHIARVEDIKEDSYYAQFIDMKEDLKLPNPVITLDEKIERFGHLFNRFYNFEPDAEKHILWNKVTELEIGKYITEKLNIEHDLDYIKCSFDDLKTKTDLSYRYMNTYPGSAKETDDAKYIPFSYGVCDSIDDILNYDLTKYYDEDYYDDEDRDVILSVTPYKTLGELLEKSDRQYAIFMTEMNQEDQPEHDGWRWHKWGPYIGKHNVKYEYLYDEDMSDIGQKHIYVFHIYEFLDNGDTTIKQDFSDEFATRVCKHFLVEGLNLNKFTNEVAFKDVGANEYNLIALQSYVDESFGYYGETFKLTTDMSVKFVYEKLNDIAKADWVKKREAKEAAEKAEKEKDNKND